MSELARRNFGFPVTLKPWLEEFMNDGSISRSAPAGYAHCEYRKMERIVVARVKLGYVRISNRD